MIFMEGRPNNGVTEELEKSKDIDKNSKRSHKKAVWQEKQGDNIWLEAKKYPIKITFKEAGPEKIWIF